MERSSIKFKYIFDDNYDPDYVNGAFGGVNPDGELVINFYMDRIPIPYETEHFINEDGSLGDEVVVTKPEEMKVRRVVKNGVVLSRETAVNIYKWLKDQLIEMGVDEDEL